MPKKKHPETPEEQAKRFQVEAERLISAGALDPDAAESAMDTLVRKENKVNRASH